MSMIGAKIELEGFGIYSRQRKSTGTVHKITKTQVVLQFDKHNPAHPAWGKVRYRLSDGYVVGGYNMSGWRVSVEDLVKLREEVPGGYRPTAATRPHVPLSTVTDRGR